MFHGNANRKLRIWPPVAIAQNISKLSTPLFWDGSPHSYQIPHNKAASRSLAGQRSSASRHFFDACGNVHLVGGFNHFKPSAKYESIAIMISIIKEKCSKPPTSHLAATAAHPNPKRRVDEQRDRSPMGGSRGSLARSE